MSTRSLAIALSGALVGSALSSMVVFAWAAPSSAAPTGNVSAPINVSATPQVKNGALSLNTLAIFGDSLLSGLGTGVGRYLNFDYTNGGTSGSGSAGYGIRDNAGTLEFKSLGGTWQSLSALLTTFFAAGSNNTVGQIKFTDGTTQTTASSGKGTIAGQAVTCSVVGNGPSCTLNCPSGWTYLSYVTTVLKASPVWQGGGSWQCQPTGSLGTQSGTCTIWCGQIQ